MAGVFYAPHKDGYHDGSIAKQTQAFIRKLFEDDTLPGLHIEPIKNSVDPKVRTGRVTDMYRAVLFKVQARTVRSITSSPVSGLTTRRSRSHRSRS
jgi:hypothetical protein